jgi:phosphatidylglycerol---prolipoprotein diacylglyceryl transferase
MPEGFFIGPIPIRFYGLILMAGAVIAAFLAEREARRRGYSGELVWDGLVWVLIGGIIGARLWHVFTPTTTSSITTADYLANPLDIILKIRDGGLGIPGAVIGGVLMLYIFTRRRKVSFATWADIAAPALALGQAIGRWGNYINQELYGPPTNVPWGIFIERHKRLPGFEEYTHFHPLFFYESIWSFGNMALLLWLGRKYPDRLKPGDLFLVYLIVYPIGRFLLEFIRIDTAQIGALNTNQTFMLVIAILSAAALFWRHRTNNRPPREAARTSLDQE